VWPGEHSEFINPAVKASMLAGMSSSLSMELVLQVEHDAAGLHLSCSMAHTA
jgi:hypothetical protein